jgi:type I restriction enzyme S subunit
VSNATGAVFDNLKTDIVRDHELSLPSLKEQTCIAEFLGAFDDKIEVNNKIIKNLEELAQTIFKEWFVKFRFPGHEKTKFVDSELGQIPEGWEVQIIRDIATIKKGISYSSSEISDTGEGLPFINLANFKRGGGIKPDGIKFYTGNYKPSDLVRPGDIVLAMTDLTSNREVIGHPARVPSYAKWDEILISLDVCAIEIEPIYIEFLYYLMLRRDFAFLMASSAGGTNVSHLSKTSIERYSFVKPTESVLGKFQEIVKPIFNKINIAEAENESLVNLRDLFLPKVIKGEVEV